MKQPKIHLTKTTSDRLLEIAALAGLLCLIGLPAYYFRQLPDIIPTHFGADGQPDGYGSKNNIWILPVTGLLIFTGLFLLNKFPHLFNYPGKITPENAAGKYKTATRMIRLLNMLLMWFFVYIMLTTLRTAQGEQEGLGSGFLLLFCVLFSFAMLFYLYRLMKNRT